MSEESDVEMKSVLPKKKTKKQPVSPTSELLKEPKRLSTKEMIDEALTELKSRKGTSLVAIKKYMELKYNVDVEKVKHIIKKYLKSSVEDGTIVQTKGVGASGSFKLVVNKKEKKIVKKMDKKEKKDKENKDKKKDKNEDKPDNEDKKVKLKSKKAESKPKEEKAKKNKVDPKDKEEKKKSSKAKTDKKTPKKKRAPMKRKSIGTIIKAPKMKPAKAKKT